MGNNLKKDAITGMIWSGLQKYSTMIIQFVSGIILARLLTPFDYGCIGMLSIFMSIAGSFIDGGFGSALIQKKHPTQEDYSTIFFWNLIVSTILYIILFFCAPLIARFYNIPILSQVLRVQAIVLFINAFTLVQSNQLRKNLNFKLMSIVTILTTVVALSVTIIMAYYGFGVWSLVAQNIIIASIPALVYWFYVKWRPLWTFSWSSFKELFAFGSFMFLTHIANNLGSNVQGLLIGKMYNPATMGYYSKAHSTEVLASSSISSVISQVTYPLYAKVQDDVKMLINMVRKLTMVISYLTFPLMFILMMTAKPIFILLYSDRWLQSVPYFQVLCLAGIVSCLISVNTQTISAIGKSKQMFIATLLKRCMGIGFIVAGMFIYGMKGLLCGVLLNTYFSYFVNIVLVSKYIGYKWYRQIKDLLPVALISIVALSVSYFSIHYFDFDIYMDAIFKTFVFIIVYILLSLVFKLDAFHYTLDVIPEKFRFWQKNNS